MILSLESITAVSKYLGRQEYSANTWLRRINVPNYRNIFMI